jgi:serine/threonine protein kinase
VDNRTFLRHLRQSQLLSPELLEPIAADLAPSGRARGLARALVEKRLLTRFQAERLLVGRTAGFVLGQYLILDEIGRGGMGRVFKARHRTWGRIVALKVLAASAFHNERATTLFLREVRAVSQLVHPNVVAAYDANEANGRYYLVLEFVDGPNLDQLIRQQGPVNPGLACDYIRQVANGLQCAHLLGMVHRDIKPGNILVQSRGLTADTPGLVKISDFGLARLEAPNAALPPHRSHPGTILTRANTVMGTPDFLSPEQSRNLHGTDIRSDLYSLGCTFYFLLTGTPPFPGGTSIDKIIRHSKENPIPVSECRPDVPAEVVAIVDRLLAKHPGERYQTPNELAEALEPFAVSGSIPWAPVRPSGRFACAEVASSPEAEADANSSDDLHAQAPTPLADQAPTPIIISRLSSVKKGLASRAAFRVFAFLLAVALFGALGACVALYSLQGGFFPN